MRHILLRPEPSCVLSSGACFFPLGPHCWGLESKSALGAPSTLHCWSMRMLCDHGKEVQEGLSVPRVSSVLLVVELELDLIFYLIHKDLGQQDSHQLGDGQA